jgi:uncharacterized membrane protein
MQKCPNCGYKVYSYWPFLLMQLAFCAVWLLRRYDPLKKYDWTADLALVAYLVGVVAFAVIRTGKGYDLKSPGAPQSTIDR